MNSRSYNNWRKNEKLGNYSMVYKRRFREALDRVDREGAVDEIERAPTTLVQPQSTRGHTRRFAVLAKRRDVVKLRTFDSPTWGFRILSSTNPGAVKRRHDDRFGRLAVELPAGEHLLEFRAGATRPYQIGFWVSVVSWTSLLLALGIFARRSMTSHSTSASL